MSTVAFHLVGKGDVGLRGPDVSISDRLAALKEISPLTVDDLVLTADHSTHAIAALLNNLTDVSEPTIVLVCTSPQGDADKEHTDVIADALIGFAAQNASLFGRTANFVKLETTSPTAVNTLEAFRGWSTSNPFTPETEVVLNVATGGVQAQIGLLLALVDAGVSFKWLESSQFGSLPPLTEADIDGWLQRHHLYEVLEQRHPTQDWGDFLTYRALLPPTREWTALEARRIYAEGLLQRLDVGDPMAMYYFRQMLLLHSVHEGNSVLGANGDITTPHTIGNELPHAYQHLTGLWQQASNLAHGGNPQLDAFATNLGRHLQDVFDDASLNLRKDQPTCRFLDGRRLLLVPVGDRFDHFNLVVLREAFGFDEIVFLHSDTTEQQAERARAQSPTTQNDHLCNVDAFDLGKVFNKLSSFLNKQYATAALGAVGVLVGPGTKPMAMGSVNAGLLFSVRQGTSFTIVSASTPAAQSFSVLHEPVLQRVTHDVQIVEAAIGALNRFDLETAEALLKLGSNALDVLRVQTSDLNRLMRANTPEIFRGVNYTTQQTLRSRLFVLQMRAEHDPLRSLFQASAIIERAVGTVDQGLWQARNRCALGHTVFATPQQIPTLISDARANLAPQANEEQFDWLYNAVHGLRMSLESHFDGAGDGVA